MCDVVCVCDEWPQWDETIVHQVSPGFCYFTITRQMNQSWEDLKTFTSDNLKDEKHLGAQPHLIYYTMYMSSVLVIGLALHLLAYTSLEEILFECHYHICRYINHEAMDKGRRQSRFLFR